jgi:hypothetical protein
MESISTLISDFKNNGWNDQQITNVLETLAAKKPDELKRQFEDLIYFFARLPIFETDVLDCYGRKEYSQLIHFSRNITAGIDGIES